MIQKYKWVLVLIVAIFAIFFIYKCKSSVNNKETIEYVKVVDSLNTIIINQEGIIDTLLTKIDASDQKINRLKRGLKPAKEIIKYEQIRIDSFIRNSDDATKREFLSNELRN